MSSLIVMLDQAALLMLAILVARSVGAGTVIIVGT